MLKKIISLLILLELNSLSQSMYEAPDEEVNASEKQELIIHIKLSSLKKQVANRIAKFIRNNLIDSAKLEILPEELKHYLHIHQQIENLDPDNLPQGKLLAGLQTNFKFLETIYLIDEDSLLFDKLPLLTDGLNRIDPTKNHRIQITSTITFTDLNGINVIKILIRLLQNITSTNLEDEQDLTTLTGYCVRFNNLSLLIFINLVHQIPLDIQCSELTHFSSSILPGSSMLNLAFITSDFEIINFFIKEMENRKIDWEELVSETAILRGIISTDEKKSRLLMDISSKLNINSNQYIGLPVEKCTPTILALIWGCNESFKFFLENIKPVPPRETALTEYNNILKEFSKIADTKTEQASAKFIDNGSIMLDIFTDHIQKEDPLFATTKKDKIVELREQLKEMQNPSKNRNK